VFTQITVQIRVTRRFLSQNIAQISKDNVFGVSFKNSKTKQNAALPPKTKP